jgi:DNA-directed RNA polymerase II subunit RPB1
MSNEDCDFWADTYNVQGVQFSILSPEEILRNSVVRVTEIDLQEGSLIDTPKCNGVCDARMGPSSSKSNVICPTDERKFGNTPGYFGHIELAVPCYW